MTAWLLVALIVIATTAGDVLQSLEMKRLARQREAGEKGLRSALRRLVRRPGLLVAIGCMAVSFFAFMALLSVADLSFAVPATAASYVVETVLAHWVLRERIGRRRWAAALLVATGVALLAA